MKELVSVIIPFYNEEQYIGDCLISLIKQTYKNIEIICVDDGSTDNGAMIVKAIQQSDSRISLIQQENMNAGTARNVGFSKAKGEYVLFLDSDDFFSPSMVERMLNKALSTNSDIVFCTGYGLNVITKETYMMPPVGKDNASFPNKEVFLPPTQLTVYFSYLLHGLGIRCIELILYVKMIFSFKGQKCVMIWFLFAYHTCSAKESHP